MILREIGKQSVGHREEDKWATVILLDTRVGRGVHATIRYSIWGGKGSGGYPERGGKESIQSVCRPAKGRKLTKYTVSQTVKKKLYSMLGKLNDGKA